MGPKTVAAIIRFQAAVISLNRPDGRVDPHGNTIRLLADSESSVHENILHRYNPGSGNSIVTNSDMLFPFRKRPSTSYKTGGRFFGAARSGGRTHAGCDLIAPPGTEICAVADGEVLADSYAFYSGTNALEVRHEPDWVVRYGEILSVAAGIKKGAKVKRGQVIAYVGKLNSGCSMLHFEMYSGRGSGNLTVRANKPYQRRSDLIDPTPFLDAAE